MKPRVGISGAGRISRFHANGFVKAGCDVVAFADLRLEMAQETAAEYGAIGYASQQQMIAKGDLDIVCIATPHDIHAEQAIEALEAGLDVFMDKPIAVTPEQGRKIAETARSLGRALGVNHNLLFHPAVILAREIIASGRIGTPLSANGWSTGYLIMQPHDFRLSRERTGGGAWVDAGPHLVYTLAELLGPINSLVALPATTPSRMGGEDTVAAVLRSESGAVASLRVSYTYVAPNSEREWPIGWTQGFEINGTEGALYVTVTPEGVVKTCTRGQDNWTTEATGLDFSQSFNGAIANYVAARAKGEPPYVTADASLAILKHITSSLN